METLLSNLSTFGQQYSLDAFVATLPDTTAVQSRIHPVAATLRPLDRKELPGIFRRQLHIDQLGWRAPIPAR